MQWQRTRTYRLTPQTIDRLDRLAKETGVWQSQLVDGLLDMGLDYVEMGRWEIGTRPGRPEMDGIRVSD